MLADKLRALSTIRFLNSKDESDPDRRPWLAAHVDKPYAFSSPNVCEVMTLGSGCQHRGHAKSPSTLVASRTMAPLSSPRSELRRARRRLCYVAHPLCAYPRCSLRTHDSAREVREQGREGGKARTPVPPSSFANDSNTVVRIASRLEFIPAKQRRPSHPPATCCNPSSRLLGSSSACQ